jgi:hypothetical protein
MLFVTSGNNSMTTKRATESNPPSRQGSWTLLSNHAHVLVCLARDPDCRLRDVAEHVGITERGVVKIVTDLERAGVIQRTRTGRRNHYEIDTSLALRHPLESNRTVGQLLMSLLSPEQAERLGLDPNAPPWRVAG